MKFLKKYGIFILLFLAVLVLIIASSHKNKKTLSDIVQYDNEETNVMCFLYEKPAELNNQDISVYDREYIELHVDDKNLVSGLHNIIPSEKDANRASLVGVTNGELVNVIATATAKGQTWQEQRVYKIQEDKLLVGYQPVYVPQYKNEYDVYMYEDINKLVYETDEFFLDKVDCTKINKKDVL